jgi:hypothetical protein
MNLKASEKLLCKEIRSQFLTTVLLPFFKIGTIAACFRKDGNVALVTLGLKK